MMHMGSHVRAGAQCFRSPGSVITRPQTKGPKRTSGQVCVQCIADKDEVKVLSGAKATIAGLDALLGIEEEVEEEEPEKDLEVTISVDAMKAFKDLEGKSSIASLERLIAESKKQKLNRASTGIKVDSLSREVKQVVQELLPRDSVTQPNVEVIKKDILGPKSFWVTEVNQLEDDLVGGVELKGNLRCESAVAFTTLKEGLESRWPGEFICYMLLDTASEEAQADGRDRILFQVLPKSVGYPMAGNGWTAFAALILFALTLGSVTSLSALVAIPKIPTETLEYLSNPDNADLATIPGMDGFDPIPFISVTLTMFIDIITVNFAHEIGHRIAAYLRGVKLAPALFVPNGSLGSFGSVTTPLVPLKDYKELWDISAAGPLAGMGAGTTLFALGILASMDPTTDPAILIPVPTFLFQGSMFLGSFVESALGKGVDGNLLVHPALIAGWVGLFTQSFNLLPVGRLDGGRMTQSAFGRGSLQWTSVLTYMGLALGVIGSALSLPFGLFVILAQRKPEKYVQDQVTELDADRQAVTGILVILAVLILIPFTPEAPEMLDMVGQGSPFQL